MRTGARGRRAARAPAQNNAGSGFAWSLLNTAATRLGTLGIGIVLARVLGPEAFGTYAVALVALLAVLSFNELGVSLAIVRWTGNPERIAPTVTTISTLSSLLVCIGALIGAPAFSDAMGTPEATPVVQVLAISVIIGGLVATPAALLQRTFDEKTRTGIDQVNVWVGAVVSVVLALLGMGAMALAVGRLAGAALSGVMFIRRSPLPFRCGWDKEHVPALLRFGLPLAGTSIVLFAVGYADQLVGGAVLGATALGFYVLAFNLSSWPLSLVSQPLRRVAPAAFASLQGDPVAMRNSMQSLMGIVAAATLPVFLFLAGSAEPVVTFVYGQVWAPAAFALFWLVLAAACRVFQELIYDYLVVLGRTGSIFRIQVSSLVVLVPSLLVGAHFGGLSGLAAAQAAVAALVTLPLYLRQLRRAGIALSGLGRSVWITAIVALGCGLVSFLVAETGLMALVKIALSGACAGISVVVLLWTRRGQFAGLRAIGESSTVTARA